MIERLPTKDDIFKFMCDTSVCIMNYHTDLIPSTVIAEHFKCSKYRAKKCLKELVNDGLVNSGYESCYNDWAEQYIIVRGFHLTRKGIETQCYKDAYERENRLIGEIFGGNAAERESK